MASNANNGAVTSTHAVLDTAELLELIISFLPMPKILRTLRVCRMWKQTIEDSPSLCNTIFLPLPDGRTKILSPDHYFSSPENITHGLRQAQGDFLASIVGMPVYTTLVALNPLLTWKGQENLHVTHQVTSRKSEPFHSCVSGLEVFSGKYSRDYVHHRFSNISHLEPSQAECSWRTMYLTSPPITDVVLHVPTSVGEGTQAPPFRAHVHAQSGVTLGMLSDKVEEALVEIQTIKDLRHAVQRRKSGPLKPKDFVKSWGKQEHAMFLVKEAKGDKGGGKQ